MFSIQKQQRMLFAWYTMHLGACGQQQLSSCTFMLSTSGVQP